MRDLTIEEKLNILCADNDAVESAYKALKNSPYVKLCKRNGKVAIKNDIRQIIATALDKNGISQYRMAQALGIPRTNFNRFLHGHVPLPLDYIEQMLWLIQEDSSNK